MFYIVKASFHIIALAYGYIKILVTYIMHTKTHVPCALKWYVVEVHVIENVAYTISIMCLCYVLTRSPIRVQS